MQVQWVVGLAGPMRVDVFGVWAGTQSLELQGLAEAQGAEPRLGFGLRSSQEREH